MLYAQVVFKFSVEGPFDYRVPEGLAAKIRPGSRVWVFFCNRKSVGYVVRLLPQTSIKNPKNIIEVIDDIPVLDEGMLLLTKNIADYYCCSWGEAIDTSLPESIRCGRKLLSINYPTVVKAPSRFEVEFLHDLEGGNRWGFYLDEIRKTLSNKQQVIAVFADITDLLKAREFFTAQLNVPISVLYRKQPKGLEEWSRIKAGEIDLVLGTRSAVFAPLANPGLIVIDNEDSYAYKQDQVPHYHARTVAFLRSKIIQCRLILGSASLSAESFHLAQAGVLKYTCLGQTVQVPDVLTVDTRGQYLFAPKRGEIFLQYICDNIRSTLENKGKSLIFLNRKGFATYAACQHCGESLKCPRCSINLVYHFGSNMLRCHYCNFKMTPPKICAKCNSGYIKYSGAGTEKVESELHRLFPQAKIKMIAGDENSSIDQADIFVSTESVTRSIDLKFDLTVVMQVDNLLNHVDFRSAEKTFRILTNLLHLTAKRMIIPTALPHHHCFLALARSKPDLFYLKELEQRKSLGFPPYRHLCIIKLRGKKAEKVESLSEELFICLNKWNKNKNIEIISNSPGQPEKLRDNFYWRILIKCLRPEELTEFLKISLKKIKHSGIIITVDMDPV